MYINFKLLQDYSSFNATFKVIFWGGKRWLFSQDLAKPL